MSFKKKVSGLALLLVLCIAVIADASSIDALIVTGQSGPYHHWKVSVPVLKEILEQTGLFTVDTAVSPPEGQDMSSYRPKFADYDVVVIDYNQLSCHLIWEEFRFLVD